MTGRDAEREQLAAALGFRWEIFPGAARAIADVVLPVVDLIANDRAAAALEAAAKDVESTHTALNALGAGVTRLNDLLDVENRLRSTAAALRASNGEGPT